MRFGLLRRIHEARLRRAIYIGVDQPDPHALLRERDREIGSDRGFADPAFTAGHCYQARARRTLGGEQHTHVSNARHCRQSGTRLAFNPLTDSGIEAAYVDDHIHGAACLAR
jgi:hypothetical protein